MSSLCQTNQHSCGACCGIFNLQLVKQDINTILEERTIDFKQSTNYNLRWTLSEFRKKREEIEKDILRVDETTYVCPFLGFISEGRIGCMVHPVLTGDPNSQNVSFYGASICQGYDCKNKENSNSKLLIPLLEDEEIDYYTYSNIVSDHITMGIIIDFFESLGYIFEDTLTFHKELFTKLIYRKFSIGFYLHQTSFEFPETTAGTPFDKICSHLKLNDTEKLYLEVVELSKNPFRGF
jgi:hypothetical protein